MISLKETREIATLPPIRAFGNHATMGFIRIDFLNRFDGASSWRRKPIARLFGMPGTNKWDAKTSFDNSRSRQTKDRDGRNQNDDAAGSHLGQ